MAHRIQAHAKPGQILLNSTAYQQVQTHVIASELGLVYFKGYTEPDRVFEVTGLKESANKNADVNVVGAAVSKLETQKQFN